MTASTKSHDTPTKDSVGGSSPSKMSVKQNLCTPVERPVNKEPLIKIPFIRLEVCKDYQWWKFPNKNLDEAEVKLASIDSPIKLVSRNKLQQTDPDNPLLGNSSK